MPSHPDFERFTETQTMLCNICNPFLFDNDIAEPELAAIKSILLDEMERLIQNPLPLNIALFISKIENPR